MAIRIQGQGPLSTSGRTVGRPAGRSAEGAETPSPEGAAGERVALSGQQAEAVAKVKAAVTSEGNAARIEALRGQIARGEYRPDLQRVAERLLTEAATHDRE